MPPLNRVRRTRPTETIERDVERARARRRRTLVTGALFSPVGAALAAWALLRRGFPSDATLAGWIDFTLNVSTPLDFAFAAGAVVLAIGILNLASAALLTVSISIDDAALTFRRTRGDAG